MRHLLAALFATLIVALMIPLGALSGCTDQPVPDVPEVISVVEEGVEAAEEQLDVAAAHIEKARQHIDAVATDLERAEKAIEDATKLRDKLVEVRASYNAKRYSEACAHLRKAIAEAEVAGYPVPPEIAEQVGLAHGLLKLAGQ
jgi:hypothetical protein